MKPPTLPPTDSWNLLFLAKVLLFFHPQVWTKILFYWHFLNFWPAFHCCVPKFTKENSRKPEKMRSYILPENLISYSLRGHFLRRLFSPESEEQKIQHFAAKCCIVCSSAKKALQKVSPLVVTEMSEFCKIVLYLHWGMRIRISVDVQQTPVNASSVKLSNPVIASKTRVILHLCQRNPAYYGVRSACHNAVWSFPSLEQQKHLQSWLFLIMPRKRRDLSALEKQKLLLIPCPRYQRKRKSSFLGSPCDSTDNFE